MTHTPGPWHVGGPYPGVSVCYTDEYDDWYPVAELWDSHYKIEATDEVKANARLIAAAPDLLEALEAISKWFDEPSEPWANEIEADKAWQLSQLVTAALAKARGEA